MIGRLRQRLRQWWRPGGLILLYHRVADVAADPWSLAVTPGHFAEHLAVLKRDYRPVSLAEVAKSEERGAWSVERGGVAITFDDGYADNWQNAVPLLARAGMPATFFVTAGMVGSRRSYWWDELAELILHEESLPDDLALPMAGGSFTWCLKGVDVSHRRPLYYTLWKCMRPLPAEEREGVLERLRDWAGRPVVARSDCRPLDREELVALAGTEGMEVGAHTVSHPQLAELTVAEQQREIEESKRRLEEVIGRVVDSFAYPFGRRGDFTAETVGLVRAAGFRYACTNLGGTVVQATDRYRLPRFFVRDGDGDQFAAWLRERRLEIGDE
jgi:peptidoglycan/xylan/chitin deacetylase (PgdA/CDA1 family)